MSGCLRGRFGLKEILAGNKPGESPYLRTKDGLEKVSLEEALSALAARLKEARAEETAFVFSESAPVEDLLAFISLGQEVSRQDVFWYYPEIFLAGSKGLRSKTGWNSTIVLYLQVNGQTSRAFLSLILTLNLRLSLCG